MPLCIQCTAKCVRCAMSVLPPVSATTCANNFASLCYFQLHFTCYEQNQRSINRLDFEKFRPALT